MSTTPDSTPNNAVLSADLLIPLVCLAIVREHNPTWVTASVAKRADESAVSRSRISRIKAAVQGRIVELIKAASQPIRRRALA